MKNSDLTLNHIQDQQEESPITTESYVIDHYGNQWDIYSNEQSEDSDPNPIFTSSDPNEILNFIQTNNGSPI